MWWTVRLEIPGKSKIVDVLTLGSASVAINALPNVSTSCVSSSLFVAGLPWTSILEAPASCFAKLKLCFHKAQSGDREPTELLNLLTLGILLGFLHSLLFFRTQSWFFLVFFIAFLFFTHGTHSK